jgi:hypothetical protein
MMGFQEGSLEARLAAWNAVIDRLLAPSDDDEEFEPSPNDPKTDEEMNYVLETSNYRFHHSLYITLGMVETFEIGDGEVYHTMALPMYEETHKPPHEKYRVPE